MGEARRSRLAAANQAPAPPPAGPSGLSFEQIERLSSEDGDDRLAREAHGFGWDDWAQPDLQCRNGCGLTYHDVVSGKATHCPAAKMPVTGEVSGMPTLLEQAIADGIVPSPTPFEELRETAVGELIAHGVTKIGETTITFDRGTGALSWEYGSC